MWKSLLLFSALVGLTACTIVTDTTGIATGTPSPVPIVNNTNDGGFFSDDPCGPPCFFDIIPGISTEEEVLASVEKFSHIFQNCESYDFTSSGGYRSLVCTYVTIGYRNSRVGVVGFKPSAQITLQQVIDRYGSPDLFAVGFVNLPEYPPRARAVLFFDQIHTMLYPPDRDGEEFVFSAGTQIISITYLSKAEYESTRNIKRNILWKGYGVYPATRR
jgi:hypothetical protein